MLDDHWKIHLLLHHNTIDLKLLNMYFDKCGFEIRNSNVITGQGKWLNCRGIPIDHFHKNPGRVTSYYVVLASILYIQCGYLVWKNLSFVCE